MLHKGDSNQQGPPNTCDEAPHTLPESSHDVGGYFDVARMLSDVDLPLPSPMLATPCTLSNLTRFDVGQSSGSKRKLTDDIEENIEMERELKSKQHDAQQPGSQSVQINTTEKRRRNRISDRIRALRSIIPNCNKRDKASILADAVEYIKFLQTQLQMMQPIGVGSMSQGLYMSPATQPSMQVPNLALDYRFMRPSIGMQYGIPQFGSYFPTNIPIFPTSFSGFPPLLVPQIDLGTGSLMPWGQTRPLVHPQELRFPSQAASQFVYSTTIPFSDTIIPTSGSTVARGQPVYHVPMTSQGTR